MLTNVRGWVAEPIQLQAAANFVTAGAMKKGESLQLSA
jgi:hypothetical protein